MKVSSPSILLVDDDVDICNNMSDILTDQGFRVETAYEGLTALKMVQRQLYDVVLLDLKMPGMDGLTLYREIKKVQSGTVAFLITGYASGATLREARAAGAWQVLPKPIDLPRLLRLIDEALERPLVLVVDDDPELCDNLWDLLHDRGYRVCIAHDGRQALERIRETTRIVLIDLTLPDQNGGDVFRQIREARPEARTMLITGHQAEMAPKVARLQAEGVDAVCYKPLDIPQFLGTLKHLAEESGGDRSFDSGRCG
jgi:DNA-binding NtrC family response regulator